MKSLKDCIPTLERLKVRGMKTSMAKATAENIAVMNQSLAEAGYTDANPKVYEVIRRYGALLLDGTAEKGLFLKGECGIGKTYGCEVLAYLFDMPVFTPEDFAADFKECEGNLHDLEKQIITGGDFFERPQNIVIDEIGSKDTVKCFGEAENIMETVLDMRYRAYLRYGVLTVVTTNLTDKEIRERYGRRIEDRIQEMFYVCRVTGKSLRSR
jgi:DNA replication protein DnaC